jgi:lipoate-protein ligase A
VRKMLGSLGYWDDACARSGPENMAVDAWLLDTAAAPVLRVYRWEGGWGSFGVFGSLAVAAAAFADGPRQWVRRMTGGGVVDHRCDWTYSLVIPRGAGPELSASASYQMIHAAVAAALTSAGEPVRMVDECGCGEAAACFVKPVAFDLVDARGNKCAGAGQRRSRRGLLHQGSVLPGMAERGVLGEALALALGEGVVPVGCDPGADELAARAALYASEGWTRKR